MVLQIPGLLSSAAYGAAATVVGLVSVVVYRRYFHPLAKIPGPFVPSVTALYMWYHNSIHRGMLYKRIDELHKEYGPIVRIGPEEVHVSDPDSFDTIYNVGTKFYKDSGFYNSFGSLTMFSTESNDEHRFYRAPLNPYFSRRSVISLEFIVQSKVHKFLDRFSSSLEASSAAGESVAMRRGLSAVTMDVFTDYAFDNCWNFLDEADYGHWFSDAVRDVDLMIWMFQQVPIMRWVFFGLIPEKQIRAMNPGMNRWLDTVAQIKSLVIGVDESIRRGEKPQRRSMVHELLDPEAGDGQTWRPSVDRLADDNITFCTAASDTTANTMEMIIYYVLSNPEIYAKLKKELRDAFPSGDELDYATLEKLPYLSSVIKEGLRLAYGVLSRLPRKVPAGGVTLNGYYLAEGLVVSSSSWDMHRNEEAFPDPDVFDPMRWVDPDAAAVRRREQCLVPFSRGSRMCLGQNLAMCELYVFLGTFFRRFENLAVADSVRPEDMRHMDSFTAFHPPNARPFAVVKTGA